MTLANTTMKDNPATPENSVIWISGQFTCSATPSPFPPNPVNNQPRNHSCATQAHARRKARRRLLVALSNGDCGTGAVRRARPSITLHLSVTGRAIELVED